MLSILAIGLMSMSMSGCSSRTERIIGAADKANRIRLCAEFDQAWRGISQAKTALSDQDLVLVREINNQATTHCHTTLEDLVAQIKAIAEAAQ